jgi:hypothetical protein
LPSVFLTDPCFCMDILVTISATCGQPSMIEQNGGEGRRHYYFPLRLLRNS